MDQSVIFYKKDTYEITIAPDDERQYQCKRGKRVNWFVEYWSNELKTNLAKYGNYSLNLEISEPKNIIGKKYPRLHYHGIIELDDPIGFLSEYAYRLGCNASVQINQWREEHWHQYCTKQKDLMLQYCLHHNVPYVLTQDVAYAQRKNPKEVSRREGIIRPVTYYS